MADLKSNLVNFGLNRKAFLCREPLQRLRPVRRELPRLTPLPCSYSLLMPNNYIVGSDTDDKDNIPQKLAAARADLKRTSGKIRRQEERRQTRLGSTTEVQDDLTILSSSYPADTTIIFYPGIKVETEAYQPLLDQIRQTGVTCILVCIPFRMAIFDSDAAKAVMEQFPEYQHWYMAGHSMGSAMASQFAADYPDEVDGFILLGVYLYGDYPLEKALTIYGSLNQSVEDNIDYTENTVEIQGGNHAQFGNYGPQKGDLPATISAEKQQEQTVEAIGVFLAQRDT